MSSGPCGSPPLRVLLVNDLPPGRGGGVEVHLERLAMGLEEHGHAVTYCTQPIRHRGPGKVLDLWDPVTARAVRRAAEHVDVVHVHNFLRELSPAVLRVAGQAALVVTVHDDRVLRSDLAGRVALRLLRHHADRTIAVSDELAAGLARHGVASCVVRPFAPADPSPCTPPRGRTVLFAGRCARSKGVHVLIDAVAQLPPELGATLIVAGTGPDIDWLRARVPQQTAERVQFVGEVDGARVVELLRDARVACLPSIEPEGWPLFIVEAMTSGRPVVATDHSSLRTMLGDGTRGLLTPIDDAPALAAALSRVLTDDSFADSLGAAARRFATDDLSPSRALAETVRIYREARLGR